MKRCSQCGLNYKDHSLEYCLEDGSHLVPDNFSDTEIPTVTHLNNISPTIQKTESLKFSTLGVKPVSNLNKSDDDKISRKTFYKNKAIEKTNRFLEIFPLILALAHNWWQWIYLANQTYSSFSNYVFSANFMIWLMLLIFGTAFGALSYKRLKSSFAIISLVILAINFIFFMVPKR